jgi:uncharacterized protein (TIGR02145 family)
MWTFKGGDPESSEEPDPEVLYTKPGLYPVKLTVTNEHGEDSLELEEFVKVNEYPLQQGTITDERDGQIYAVTIVGGQWFTAQNMNFDTGDAVYYDHDPDYADIHGMLYTWESAMEACPAGWRLPTRGEYDLLREYLGGEYVAGGKLKESGTENWEEPNAYGTNSTSFSAVGSGGYQPGHLKFYSLGESVTYWTQTEIGDDAAWSMALSNRNGRMAIQNTTSKNLYFSVRCIKD